MRQCSWKGIMGGAVLAGLLGAAGAFGADSRLDTRINMAVRDADPADTFRTFAKLMGVEAVVSPNLTGKVTLELKNVRVRTLLDAVCESIGCRWELTPDNPPKLRVDPEPGDAARSRSVEAKEPIDLKVTKADARDLLATFGQILGAQTDIDPAITGEVSIDLRQTPWDRALDTVCHALSCEWKLVEGERKVLRVTPRSKKR